MNFTINMTLYSGHVSSGNQLHCSNPVCLSYLQITLELEMHILLLAVPQMEALLSGILLKPLKILCKELWSSELKYLLIIKDDRKQEEEARGVDGGDP